MGEVSKFAKGGGRKLLRGKELGEFDSVKKVSILIDIDGRRQDQPLFFDN
jgi:hypothetical protein